MIVPVEVVPVEVSQKTFIDSIRPLILHLQLTGLLPVRTAQLKDREGGRGRSWRWYCRPRCEPVFLWFVIINLFLVIFRVINWWPIFEPFLLIISNNDFSMLHFSALVTLTCVFIWSTASWLVAIFGVSSFQKFISKFSDELQKDVDKREAWDAIITKIGRRAKAYIFLLYCVTLWQIIYNSGLLKEHFTLRRIIEVTEQYQYLYDIGCPEWFVTLMSIFSQIAFLFDIYITLLPIFMYLACCQILAWKFNMLTERYSDVGRPTLDLEHERLRHDAVCQLTEDTNTYYNSYIIITTLLEIVVFIGTSFLVIYGSQSSERVGDMDINQLASLALVMLFIFALVAVFRIAAAIRVHEKAHSITAPLNAMSCNSLTEADRDQLIILLSKMNGSQIGMTVGKIFVLTRSHLLTVVSVCTTYVILMIQFQQTEESD